MMGNHQNGAARWKDGPLCGGNVGAALDRRCHHMDSGVIYIL